jgi:hypothetical protein
MPNFAQNSFDQLHRGWESMYGRGYRQPAPVTHNPEMGQPLGAGEGDPYLPVNDPARIGTTPLISPAKITASSAPPTLPAFNPTAPTAKKDSESSGTSSDQTQALRDFVHKIFHPDVASGGAPYVAGGVVGPPGSFTGGGIASAAPDLGIGAPLGSDEEALRHAILHALRLQPTPMNHDPAVGGFGGMGGGGAGAAAGGGMGGIQDAIKGLVGSFYSDVPSFKFDNPQTGQPQPAYFQPPGLSPNTGGVLPYTT